MAGESAREMSRKMRVKSERLARAADAWERGAYGEDQTAQELATLPAEYTVLHDLHWPGRQRANLDHVVIGPTGVFVIDSKNWSGEIAVDAGVLRQDGRAREQAVVGAAEAALAVARVLSPLPPTVVVPVLSFVRDEQITGWARDVVLCSTPTLLQMITTRPPVLGPTARAQACAALARAQSRPIGPPAAPPVLAQPGRPPDPARKAPTKGGKRRSGLAPLLVALVVLAALVLTPVSSLIGAAFAGLMMNQVANAGPSASPDGHAAPGATRWEGTYRCGGTTDRGRLDVWERRDGRTAAVFRFGAEATGESGPRGGSYRLLGAAVDGVLALDPTRWIDKPPGYVMVGFRADLPTSGGALAGRVDHPACTTFRFTRG